MYVEGDIPTSVNTKCDNGGFFGGNGWGDLAALIVVAGLFGGFGGGFGFGGNSGANANYVLSSDFATIQRQLSDGFGATESKLDSISNGICSLGYDQLGQMNGINTNIMQSTNALQAQLAQCCCDNKAAIADLKYTMATDTCSVIQAGKDNTQRIIDYMTAKDYAAVTAENASLKARISNDMQTATLLNAINRTPTPAYVVPNPYCCNYNYGCGCNGTSIQ